MQKKETEFKLCKMSEKIDHLFIHLFIYLSQGDEAVSEFITTTQKEKREGDDVKDFIITRNQR